MSFIESFLHLSPDGGNGSAEFYILTLFVLTVGVLAALWFARRNRRFHEEE